MINLFKETYKLRQEGKLHKRLLTRLRMTFIISIILGGITVFNILFRDANALISGVLVFVGFILGLFIFSRMNIVNWNEEEEAVQMGKMDTIGYLTIGLYIFFEIGLRTYLNSTFPLSSVVFLLAAISGTLFGRAIGMVIEIHKVFRLNHPHEHH